MDNRLKNFENAYVVRYDPELETRLNAELDLICKDGETGVQILIDRLYKDVTLTQSQLSAVSKGDMDHNEWLKRKMLVRAIGRSGAGTAVRHLAPLLLADCRVSQFHEILRPALARALGELGGHVARDALLTAKKSGSTNLNTTTAILEALDNLKDSGAGDGATFAEISKKEKTGKIGILAFRSKSSLFEKIFKPGALYQRVEAVNKVENKIQRVADVFALLKTECNPVKPFVYGESFKEAWNKASGDIFLVVDFEDKYPDFEIKMKAQNYYGEWELFKAYATNAIALGLTAQFLTKKTDAVLNF